MEKFDFKKIKIGLHNKNVDVSQFDCSHNDINEFLKEDSLRQKAIMLNSTYVAKYNNEVIGFVTLSTDRIELKNLDERYKQKFQKLNIGYETFPALKIGRLAVTNKYKKHGIGTYLLRWIFYFSIVLSNNLGLRFITLDAYLGDSHDFYKKNYCRDSYNQEKLKKEFKKFERLKKRKHPDAYKITVPMFMDLCRYKNYFSQEDCDF